MKLYNELQILSNKDVVLLDKIYEEYTNREGVAIDNKIDVAMENINVSKVTEILKNNFDNMMTFLLFGVIFDIRTVRCVLNNRFYIYFLIKSHLINRVCNLTEEECTPFLIRFYHSILTFAEYI